MHQQGRTNAASGMLAAGWIAVAARKKQGHADTPSLKFEVTPACFFCVFFASTDASGNLSRGALLPFVTQVKSGKLSQYWCDNLPLLTCFSGCYRSRPGIWNEAK
jgi:hypothetical protein